MTLTLHFKYNVPTSGPSPVLHLISRNSTSNLALISFFVKRKKLNIFFLKREKHLN